MGEALLIIGLFVPSTAVLVGAGILVGTGHLGFWPVIAVTAATPGEDHLASVGASFAYSRGGPFQPGQLTGLLAAALRLSSGEAQTGSPATP